MKYLFLALTLAFSSCNVNNSQNNQVISRETSAKLQVYFFHGTHRCQGCINAEQGTINALNSLYKTQLDNGTIQFQSVNVEESENKLLAEKYEAAWNKLLFIKNDDSAQTIDLTEQAFAYGIDNPDEMNKLVKATVDLLLK